MASLTVFAKPKRLFNTDRLYLKRAGCQGQVAHVQIFLDDKKKLHTFVKIWYGMAKDLAEQLSRIGHKAELLVTRYATLREDNEKLRRQLTELKAELKARDALIDRQRIELEHLKISSAIAPDTATAREARATLTELVRDIDACVADLMKDI